MDPSTGGSDTRLSQHLGFELNPDQYAAVTADVGGPLLISAGAGSGKTTVMAARVLWAVLNEWVEPSQVLGLTFTRKAAHELSLRMGRLLGENGSDVEDGGPHVLTYHSFAHELVTEFGALIGLEPNCRLVSDHEALTISRRFIEQSETDLSSLGNSVMSIAALVRQLDQRCSESAVSPMRLQDFDARLVQRVVSLATTVVRDRELMETAERRSLLAEAVIGYRSFKRDLEVVDFGDVLRFAVELTHVQAVREVARSRWQMVMLDEYQDTSPVQARLLSALFDDGHPVTAVGDPLQAIYGWRGASAGSMEGFIESFGGDRGDSIRVLGLPVSQRCSVDVLAAANAVSAPLRRQMSGPLAAALEPAAGAGAGLAQAALFDTSESELEWLVERLGQCVNEGYAPNQIAVLCRSATTVARVSNAMGAAGIDHCTTGADTVLSNRVVRQILAILRVAAHAQSNNAMLEILVGPRLRIGPRDLALIAAAKPAVDSTQSATTASEPAFVSQLVRGAVDSVDPLLVPQLEEAVQCVIKMAADATGDDRSESLAQGISIDATRRLRQLGREIEQIRDGRNDGLPDQIERAASLIGATVELLVAGSRYDRDAYLGLLELGQTFDRNYGGELTNFLDWLDMIEKSETQPKVDSIASAGDVVVMTTHKSKGLEWDVVFVPEMSDGSFPVAKSLPRWTTSESEIPHELRHDAAWLPTLRSFGTKGHEEFVAEMKDYQLAEERRLGYVALTRARRQLFCSGHWWGPTQRRKRGPAQMLIDVRDANDAQCTTTPWVVDVTEDNPQLVGPAADWPPTHDVGGSAATDPTSRAAELTSEEELTLSQLDAELALLDQYQELTRRGASVRDQRRRSVTSQLERAARDTGDSEARRRGVAFHRWVAQRYGQPMLFDELPSVAQGPSQEPPIDDLIEGFERCEFSSQRPWAVEVPVMVAHEGQLLAGRIDAIFRRGDRWVIVDWKTGGGRSDPTQLRMYRDMWCLREGIDPATVDCCFVNVSSGTVEELIDDRVSSPQ